MSTPHRKVTIRDCRRMAGLRQAGLSERATGIVMGLYHGLPLGRDQVRYYVQRVAS